MDYIIDFVLAPSNKYVGWVVYNNGYFFGSGNNLSRMVHNVKQGIYKTFKGKVKLVCHLASRPTERHDVPVHKMTEHFKTMSYFAHKTTGFLTEEQAETFERIKPKAEPTAELKPAPKTNEEFVCEERDGVMIVYKLVEVNRYKLHKTPWEPQTKGVNYVNSED